MCVYGQSPKMQGESRGLSILLSKQDGVGHRKKDKRRYTNDSVVTWVLKKKPQKPQLEKRSKFCSAV